MDAERIRRLNKLSGEVQNFRECYESVELWAQVDGKVDCIELLAFLIENPHFQKIADNIKTLDV